MPLHKFYVYRMVEANPNAAFPQLGGPREVGTTEAATPTNALHKAQRIFGKDVFVSSMRLSEGERRKWRSRHRKARQTAPTG